MPEWCRLNIACVQGSTNGTNGIIPIPFKVLPMVPLVSTNGTIGNTIGTNVNANGTIGPPNGTIGTNGKPMVPLATNGTIGKISNGTIGRTMNARLVGFHLGFRLQNTYHCCLPF